MDSAPPASLPKLPVPREVVSHRGVIHLIAIGLVWGFATAMLAICIPLVTATQSGVVLPLSVILGATVGTVVVWRSPNTSSQPILPDLLEERIANLETADSSFAIPDNLKQLEASREE